MKRVVTVALTLALVALLVGMGWLLATHTSAEQWRRIGEAWASPWILPAVLGLGASFLLRAARLQAEWRGRTGATYGDCLMLFVLHNAAVIWLPMRSGEAGYALWLKRRWDVPLKVSLTSLLWLRLQDALVLAILSVAVWLALKTQIAPVAGLLLGAVLAVLGAVAVTLGQQRWGARIARACAAPGPGLLAGVLRLAAKVTEALASGRGGWRAWAYCVVNWVIKLATLAGWMGLAAALNGNAALLGSVAGEWAGVLPVQAPGGVGTYEAAVWLGVRSAAPVADGAAASAALVLQAAVSAHALSLVVASLAALLALAWRFLQRRQRAPVPLEPGG